MKSIVSLVKCDTYEQEALFLKIKEAFALLGGAAALIKPGSKVLLKPNLLMAVEPERNITTHPEFVRGVIRILKELNCKIYLGDDPSVFGGQIEDVLKVYEKTGMLKMAQDEGIEMVTFEKKHQEGRFFLSSWIKDCDFIINIPKFKTHEFMILTGAVKNLFGLIPGSFKVELHKKFLKHDDFADMLLDIYQIVKPAVSIIDGISGIEGNGPATSGTFRNLGLIAASSDAIALDCVLAKIMNTNPENIWTNKRASLRKIGNTDFDNIEIKGAHLSDCVIADFKLPEASLREAIKNMIPGPIAKVITGFLTFRPRIDTDVCQLCEACIKICPQKTIFKRDQKIVINEKNCISCFCCREVCLYQAIKIKKSLLARMMGM